MLEIGNLPILVAVIVLATLVFKWIGKLRVGTRRSCVFRIIQDDVHVRVEERSTGLMDQWYTDQPIQRIYALAFSGIFSNNGLKKLSDKVFMQRCVLALIRRHPVLTTTIVRDKSTGRASLQNTYWKKLDDLQWCGENTHPFGPLPIHWHDRENAGNWHDVAFTSTHTDMDESSWLFSIEIVRSESSNRVEIIIVTHHLLTDGLSSVVLLKDFILALSNENSSIGSFDTLLPKTPLVILDQQVDMRPPVALVLSVIGEDSLPSWLRKPLTYWQGPKPNISEPCEGHFATLTVSPKLTKALLSIAKEKQVSMNGLISTIFLDAEVLLVKDIEQKKDDDLISIKYLFPVGRGIRELGNISQDQVGVYITGSEHIAEVNARTLSDPDLFWKLAKQITQFPRFGVQESLDFTGLLNFLPRDSITPWLIKEGQRSNHGRRSSIELSNLGLISDIEKLKMAYPGVLNLFDSSNESELPEVYLINGRNYRGSVFNVGITTIQHQMCIAVQCQLGHCGCGKKFEYGVFTKVIKGNALNGLQSTDDGLNSVCACPKQGMLQKYCVLIESKIKELILNYSK